MNAHMAYCAHGAARQVTGSCHLLRFGERRILVDCGLFQGDGDQRDLNYQPFGFEPLSIDALLLTHAHLDHCGRIPRLVRQGFRGRILATAATRDLARIVLLDAAGLQEEDAARAERSSRRRGELTAAPLFTIDDALHCLDYFDTPVEYDQTAVVTPGVTARFLDAGHILGSASILVTLEDQSLVRTVLFSGDIGSSGRPMLRDPVPAPAADYVVMETTYGNRPHRSLTESVNELYRAIRETSERGGNVVIPTFALERAQEILYYLHLGALEGKLRPGLPVFLDSPMAISATEIFRRHSECFDRPFLDRLRESDPFTMPNLRFTRDVEQSMAINRIESGAVILAGSGMCSGGRVRHHLKHNLWRDRCSIVFVGYAAEGTLARRIIDGARSVHLFGEDIQVRAQVWTINGFSAHADQGALLSWLGGSPRREVLLVHGEYDRGMAAMGVALQQRGIVSRIPGMHETIALT